MLHQERVEFLDFLRGIAILLVFFTHVRSIFDSTLIDMYGNLFSRGVQLFYLVSGFTIFMIYIDKINSFASLKVFMVKRFFRVMPLLYILLPIYYFTFGLGLKEVTHLPHWYHFLSHYTLMFGFHPETMNSIIGYTWSIFDEFLFYVLFGLLLVLNFKVKTTIHRYIVLFLIISLATFMINNLYFNTNPSLKQYFYFSPLIQMYIFFLGGGLYLFSKRYTLHKYIFYLSVVMLVLYPLFISSSTLSTYISSFLFSLMILYMAQNQLSYKSFFLYLGKISFSLYLIHGFVIQIFLDNSLFGLNSILSVVAIFIIAFLVSMVSYSYIEQPFIRYGKRLLKQNNYLGNKQ